MTKSKKKKKKKLKKKMIKHSTMHLNGFRIFLAILDKNILFYPCSKFLGQKNIFFLHFLKYAVLAKNLTV